MRMEEAFYNISMYSYNKNILEYADIAQNGTESKIPYIESHSYAYGYDKVAELKIRIVH